MSTKKPKPAKRQAVTGKLGQADGTDSIKKGNLKFNSKNSKKFGKSGWKNEESADSDPQILKQLLKSSGKKWYEMEDDLKVSKVSEATDTTAEDVKPITEKELRALESKTAGLMDAEAAAYINSSMNGPDRSDFLWMNKVMKTGTLPDRMAAYTVRIQDSPVHNVNCLEQLIGQVKTQGKQQCLMTAETVKDLFLQDLLPPNRKLKSFSSRGSSLVTATNKQLILWLYEDKLKNCYGKFVHAVGRMANDTVEKLRGKAISIIQQLLTDHPEEEQALLGMLVNKLGDPAQKVASRALFHLNKVVKAHPRMKKVLVEEVERLLFRNNIGPKAQYYGICFLNLLYIEEDHPQLAVKLIKVYLAFFKACVKKGEIDSRLMNALLQGVNKAFPRSQMMGFELSESIDTLYKIVRMAQFNVGLQALSLLLQIVNVQEDREKADRYYRILYEKVLSPEVATTAHGMKLLNLIYRSLQADSNIRRVTAFAKRLLQICHHVPSNIACAILFLLSEVSKTHRGIFRVGEKESAKNKKLAEGEETDDDEDSEPQIENLESLLKKTNVTVERPEVSRKSDKSTTTKTEKIQGAESTAKAKPGDGADIVEVKPEIRVTKYDIQARNPAYSGAELTLAYELTSLQQHFHPSVALFAKTLLRREFVKYDGNPLKDFTVARFLERFVYRNPKVNKLHSNYQPRGLRKLAVNSSAYLEAGEAHIPVDEQFFYKYFKGKKGKPVTKKEDGDESDVESVGDDEFDEIMSGYFKSHGVSMSDGEEDDEIDFAADVKTQNKGKKKKGKGKQEDEDDDDDDDEEEEGEDDVDFDDMEGAYENSDLDDEEAIDADDFVELGDGDDNFDLDAGLEDEADDDDLDDDSFVAAAPKAKKRKMGGKGMFVPAEQFAEMLDENAEYDVASSHTFVNKDRADMKQLKWETDRDRWVKGYKKSSKTSFKSQKGKRRKL